MALYEGDSIRTSSTIIPFADGFYLPTDNDLKNALSTERTYVQLPNETTKLYQAIYKSGIDGSFEKIPACESHDDWLAQYVEDGQSFDEYLEFMTSRSGRFKPSRVGGGGRTVCIVPIGHYLFSVKKGGIRANMLKDFTEIYYPGLKIVYLPPINIVKKGRDFFWVMGKDKFLIKGRYAHGRQQLLVDPLLHRLVSIKNSNSFKQKHKDAFLLMALTMEDLYEEEPDLFVSGMAAGGSGVAVFSFARYSPNFIFSREYWYRWIPVTSQESKTQSAIILAHRICKLFVHELGHLLGIDHCKWYRCCMNGSGHLAEDHSQPLYLCPIDLRKVQFRLRLSVEDLMIRYQKLYGFYRSVVPKSCSLCSFESDAQWIVNRIGKIQKQIGYCGIQSERLPIQMPAPSGNLYPFSKFSIHRLAC